MHSPSDRFRLSLALLLSVLLHAALLAPGASPRPGTWVAGSGKAQDTVLSAGLRPPPAARPTVDSSAQLQTPSEASRSATSDQPPMPQADPRGHYLAEQLSRPPRPLKEIDLNVPEAGLLSSPGRLRLTLWIDADGRVLSYHIDAPDLPEEYTTAVAEVFASTRYAPGELFGRKVGSILKLEIEHQAAP